MSMYACMSVSAGSGTPAESVGGHSCAHPVSPPPQLPAPCTHGLWGRRGGHPSSLRCWTGWSCRSRSWRGCWRGSPPRSVPGAPTPWCWATTCPSRAAGTPRLLRGLATARGAPRSAGTAERSGGWAAAPGPCVPPMIPPHAVPRCGRVPPYHVLHGAQVLGAVAVAVVVGEVGCRVAVLVADAEVGTIHHQDLAALGRGRGSVAGLMPCCPPPPTSTPGQQHQPPARRSQRHRAVACRPSRPP